MLMRISDNLWRAISAVEVAIAAVVIVLDLWIPTLIVLALLAVSLIARREKPSSIGLKKPKNLPRMLIIVLVLAFAWTAIQFSLTLPLLNHLSGTTQSLGTFENLKGNVGSLLTLLFFTWTLAALGEEIVYRGYLQRRCRGVFGSALAGLIIAVAVSSVLFGLAHLEQGVVGVAITAVDAVFFSALKHHFDDNLFASVLAHGFNNTIGIVAFFLVGPVYGLW